MARRAEFLPFSPPSITEAEIEAVVDTLRSGWITTGPKTNQFETDFAAFLGVDNALAVNSCTAGLHIALRTLNIGVGDEVIAPSMTFASSVNVIEHVGAKPVLVDMEPDTFCIDPEGIAAAITPHTKAIMVVHFGGHPAEMQPIMELARQHNIAVIEDAAHAVPADYEGQRIGTIGDYAAFSFYATKNMTTGEGGMLVSNRHALDRARALSLHGMSRDAWKRYNVGGSWFYEVVEPGYKYNMTDIQAALGLIQLSRLEAMQTRRREIVARYHAGFESMPQAQTPIERENVRSAWHLYVLRLNLDQLSIDRAQFIEALKARNIGASVHFIPIHIHPYYRDKYGYESESLPVTYKEYQRTISLPLHPGLSDADVDDVIHAVHDVIEQG
jgi:dTDP-4-amino-4,6-dideoxygalactose transaminase